jgi:TetR/AcrR family transcriptional regulator
MRALAKPQLPAGLLARRRHRRGETRAAILASAARIFAQSGVDGARMDAIASAAGVNKAMLYYYFKSKDLLYSAVLENHFKEFHRRAMEVFTAGGSASSILLRFVEAHFDFISSQRDYSMLFQRLMLTNIERIERLVRKYYMPIARELFEVVERGQRDGEFRRVDSQHMVISLVALNVFYFSAARIFRIVADIDPYSEANRKRRKEEVLQLVRHGLFRNPEDPAA